MKVMLVILSLLLTLAAPVAAQIAHDVVTEAPSRPLRRMALLVSANDGGFGRPRLRWTGDDANAMGAVLTELGGVAAGDVHYVVANDNADVEANLVRLDDEVKAARAGGARVELIVYYSGHSDADGLLLGNDRLPWSTLRARVAEMNADVRVVILDSCSSGALVRSKGGKHLPPFVLDDGGGVRGHAFLTSSRDDEPAQESDRVRGSFFTHALITGLRGAADATGDGLVTLNEAYQFAFQETLARTELAAGGAQHPAYDIQLAGSGEWIVTDLRDSSAGLVLGADVVGRVLLRDDRGRLVAELQKGATEVVLGVPAGSYDVRVLQPGKAFSTTITVRSGEKATLSAAALQENPVLATTARGGDIDNTVVDDAPRFVFANAAFVPPIESNVTVEGGAHNAFGFHLIAGSQRRLTGFNLAGGLNITTETLVGAELAGVANIVGADTDGVLVGGGANIVGTKLRGLALGGVGNVVGSVDGVLLAGAANIIVTDAKLFALAGAANVFGGRPEGLQLAGAFNWTPRGFNGAQVAGGVNIGVVDNSGLALSTVNIHERFAGAQLGVINIGGDVAGTQVGVVNIARSVVGAQVGVVNVAGHADVSVGIINAVGDGIHHVGVMGTDLFPAMIAARLGAARNYGVFEIGWSPFLEDGHQIVTMRAGPGIRFPFEVADQQLHLDVEAVGGVIHRADNLLTSGLHLATALRALVRWTPMPALSLYGGPAMNVLVVDHTRTFNMPLTMPFRGQVVDTLLAPGFALGIDL